MDKKKGCHRDEKLDSMLGKNVEVTFYDGKTRQGKLIYVEEFSEKYDYRRPWRYNVGNTSFMKSSVKKIREVS